MDRSQNTPKEESNKKSLEHSRQKRLERLNTHIEKQTELFNMRRAEIIQKLEQKHMTPHVPHDSHVPESQEEPLPSKNAIQKLKDQLESKFKQPSKFVKDDKPSTSKFYRERPFSYTATENQNSTLKQSVKSQLNLPQPPPKPARAESKLKNTPPTSKKEKSIKPSPAPRRKLDKNEKVLKKLQRNLTILDEILHNDSDVDSDEMDDLKHNLNEAEYLILGYKEKLLTLEGKKHPIGNIKKSINKIKNDIAVFRGLQRDDDYKLLKERIEENVKICEMKRCEWISDLKECAQLLEVKTAKNEKRFTEILQEQVTDIYEQTVKNNKE